MVVGFIEFMMISAPNLMGPAGPLVHVVAMRPDTSRNDVGRGRLVMRLGIARRRPIEGTVLHVDAASRLVDGLRSRVDGPVVGPTLRRVPPDRRLVIRLVWPVRIALGRRERRADAQ